MARPSYNPIIRANEILQLALGNGSISDPTVHSDSQVLREAQTALGEEFSDVELEMTDGPPFIRAKAPPILGMMTRTSRAVFG